MRNTPVNDTERIKRFALQGFEGPKEVPCDERQKYEKRHGKIWQEHFSRSES